MMPFEFRPLVDAEQATLHLERLHRNAKGYGSLVLLGWPRRERHSFYSLHEMVRSVDLATSSAGLQDFVDQRWNVYTACSTFGTTPVRGRGTRSEIGSVPGVWADFDVKPDTEDYFHTEDQLMEYLGELPRPTLSVASGSGGRHLYWLTHERLKPDTGQELLHAWLDYLRSLSAGHSIENVQDTPRILRLAGTVRWPKDQDPQCSVPRRVELLDADGPRYHVGELETRAQEAHEAAQRIRGKLQLESEAAKQRFIAEFEKVNLGEASAKFIKQSFDHAITWDELLLETGWTLHSDRRNTEAQCRYWTRPGKTVMDGKSASTDWESSTSMVIYSQDPSLADLRENMGSSDAHAVCSKWHYAKIMIYGGDEQALIADTKRRWSAVERFVSMREANQTEITNEWVDIAQQTFGSRS